MKHLVVLLMVGCLGCAQEKSLSGSGGGSSADLTTVEGEWEKPCSVSGALFEIRNLDFSTDGKLVIESTLYSEAACTTELYSSVEEINYWLVRVSDTAEDKYHWNWESQTLSYTPSEAQAETWNSNGFCNYGDWEADELVDRTDQDCHTTTLFYDLLKTEDDQLFLGDRTGDNDGTSNDERPVLVEDAAYER